MKTIATEAPTSQTSARCNASTPGAAVVDGREPPAVAAYAITHSQNTRKRNKNTAALSASLRAKRHVRRSSLSEGGSNPWCRVGIDGFLRRYRSSQRRLTSRSISVLVLGHQRQRRLEQDADVEPHRPVLDVIEIELDALLDLLVGVDFAAPSVDLRPAGDPGLDAVAREIAVDGFVEQPALQFALYGVRRGPNEREVALEHDVEELRQFVEAGLAYETPDARNTGIALGHDLGGGRVGQMVVHRAKLEDVDALIVEAEALLAEQHRPRAIELHRERQQQDQEADDVVEQPLHHQIPVGDRRFEHVEGGHLAEIGIGAGPEAQLVGMG